MQLTYDSQADAAYITLGSPIAAGAVDHTIHSIRVPRGGEIALNFDADGRLLGIEVLTASEVIAPEILAHALPPGQHQPS